MCNSLGCTHPQMDAIFFFNFFPLRGCNYQFIVSSFLLFSSCNYLEENGFHDDAKTHNLYIWVPILLESSFWQNIYKHLQSVIKDLQTLSFWFKGKCLQVEL